MANVETGNGTTVSLSGGFTATAYVVNGSEETIEDINDSNLTTTGSETFTPGDLATDGEMTLELVFDSTAAAPSTGTVETLTLTHAIPPGGSAGATQIGTGYWKGAGYPNHENNTRKSWNMTWKWDGKTGPAFSVGS